MQKIHLTNQLKTNYNSIDNDIKECSNIKYSKSDFKHPQDHALCLALDEFRFSAMHSARLTDVIQMHTQK